MTSRPRSSLLTECPWMKDDVFCVCVSLSLSRSARAHLAASLSPSASGRKRFSQDKKRTGARAQTHNEKTRFSFASESVWWSLLPFSTSNPRAQEKEILNCQKDGEERGGGEGRGWVGALFYHGKPAFLYWTEHNVETTTRETSAWKNQRKIKTLWSDRD